MYFDNVIIIGSGKIACDCVNYLVANNVDVSVIETLDSTISMLAQVCKKNKIVYSKVFDKEKIEKCIMNLTKNNTMNLLISANNEYIFSKKIIDLSNIMIINFHYGYLPDYRGMNIPTWVIYNNEDYTGITWHYVNENIDDGDIIIKKKIELNGQEKAIDIVRCVMQKGKEAFEEIIMDFLKSPIKGEHNELRNGHIYRRSQLPEDGFLDINCKDYDKIITILRAFDYGQMNVIPSLKVKLNGRIYEIVRYRIIKENKIISGSGKWESNYAMQNKIFRIEFMLKDNGDD